MCFAALESELRPWCVLNAGMRQSAVDVRVQESRVSVVRWVRAVPAVTSVDKVVVTDGNERRKLSAVTVHYWLIKWKIISLSDRPLSMPRIKGSCVCHEKRQEYDHARSQKCSHGLDERRQTTGGCEQALSLRAHCSFMCMRRHIPLGQYIRGNQTSVSMHGL